MLSLVTKTQSESLAEGEGMFVFLAALTAWRELNDA
jgi:hypothetical protein